MYNPIATSLVATGSAAKYTFSENAWFISISNLSSSDTLYVWFWIDASTLSTWKWIEIKAWTTFCFDSNSRSFWHMYIISTWTSTNVSLFYAA